LPAHAVWTPRNPVTVENLR